LLLKLAAHLRAMQLYYHSAHHHSSRVAFFGDHSAFSDFYQALDDQYDSAAERVIGNYGQDALNLQVLMSLVTPKLQLCPSNTAKTTLIFLTTAYRWNNSCYSKLKLCVNLQNVLNQTNSLSLNLEINLNQECIKLKNGLGKHDS
jgi:hypothetical protein